MQFAPTNLNDYALSIYEANKVKGFWIKEPNYVQNLVLIQSEMYEALEADRKSLFAKDVFKCLDRLDQEDYASCFEEEVKNTWEDELADVVIRLLDMAAGFGLYISNNYMSTSLHFWGNQHDSLGLLQRENYSFHACLLEFGYIVNKIVEREVQSRAQNRILEDGINELLAFTIAVCSYHNVDVWMHVKLKLAYNRTRAYKHGKQY